MEGDIIDNTYSKMIFRFIQFQVFINSQDLGRCGVLGAQAITTGYDYRFLGTVIENIPDVKIQGISICTGFLGPVKHCNTLN